MTFAADALTLFEDLAVENGKEAVYRKGPASLLLTLVPGRSLFDAASNQGGVIQFESADWIACASDLESGGAVFLPEKGHTIEVFDALESRTRVFEVLPPIAGGVCFTPVDPDRVLLRIHSKEIRQTSALA